MAIRKRTITALLLCAAMLLAGCVLREGEPVSTRPTPTPEPVTAASLWEKMSAALAQKGSASADVTGSMDYTLLAEDGERETHLDLTLTGESTLSPRALHARGSAGVRLLGMDMDVPLELYALEEESGAVLCLGVLGEWTRQSVGKTGQGAEESSALLRQAASLSPATETLGEHSCYRLDIPVSAQMLARSAAGLALTAPESGPALRLTLWADEQSFLPVRLTLSLTEPLVTHTMTIRALELNIDYTAFGTVSGITPPPEALSAPERGA